MEKKMISPPPAKQGRSGAGAEIVDTDKLSYEIFSILESKFLFGYDDNEPLPLLHQRGKVCILSVDGAGAGGRILAGKALEHLQLLLRSKSGDPDARISDYFDLAAGTGVGGVLVAMLFSSGASAAAEDAWRFLADNCTPPLPLRFLDCVVGGRRRTKKMERALKAAMGEKTTLRDTVKPLLIPCFDLRSSAPIVFSRADAVEADGYDFPLWEVCGAAMAAAPAAAREVRSVDGSRTCLAADGGLCAMANPTAAAITHVLHNKQEFPFVRGVEDLIVLSVGGGGGVSPDSAASDGAADLVDQAVGLTFSQSRSSSYYVRVQAHDDGLESSDPGGGRSAEAAAAAAAAAAEKMLRRKNVESMLFSGRRVSERTNSEVLDWLAGELVLEHRRRGRRIAPTVAFKQAGPAANNNNQKK